MYNAFDFAEISENERVAVSFMTYDSTLTEIVKAMNQLDEWYNTRNRSFVGFPKIVEEYVARRDFYLKLFESVLQTAERHHAADRLTVTAPLPPKVLE